MDSPPEHAHGRRLQDLIERRKRELRLAWEDMVTRSTASGYTISLNRWHHWAQTEWTKTPNPDVVRSIAAALEVSTDAVYEAAGVSVNLYTRTVADDKTSIMVAAFQEVPGADQDMVIEMVQAVVNARRAAGSARDAERKS